MEFSVDHSSAMPPGLCALQQHPYYADALRAMGATVLTVTVRDGARRIAQARIVRRRKGPVMLNWLPRGPVWAPGVARHERRLILDALPRLQGCSGIWIAAPETPMLEPAFDAAGFRPLMTRLYVAELPLTAPEEARLAAQAVKWRNRLRHGQRSPLKLQHRAFDPDRDQWLLEQEAEQQRERRYSALPAGFTLAYARTHPDATRLFLARLRGRIVATLLVLRHPPTATYHIGWSGEEGRRHSAHNLLLWEAANWLARHGCQRFDLGQVDTENAPGLARFKIGSGAQVRPLGPTMLRLPGLARRRRAA